MSGAMHESYVDQATVAGPSDRSFGLTVGSILCAVAALRWFAFAASPLSTALMGGVGILLILFALISPQVLSVPNHLWMRLGYFLARIVNPVVMFLMFAVVFVPGAIIMRFIGRDALQRDIDRAAMSYWIRREPPGPQPVTMINQF